jgi:ABC-type transport system involved in multi-copper enzyme maturation permease subunit
MTMAASTPAAPFAARQDPSAGTGHAHFGRLLLAEWTKLRSVRSTYWSLIILILVFTLFSWLFPYLTVRNFSQASPTDQANLLYDPVSTILTPGLGLGQLAIAVLGVMVTASEYSTGMIRSTLLASPHRTRTLAAKSVVFALLVFVIGEIIAFIGFFVGRQTFENLLTVNLSGPVLRQVFGVGLYLAMLGVFSLVLGSLIRHVAGAITLNIALLLVVSPIVQLVPGRAGKYLYTYDPTNAGAAVVVRHESANFLISAWEGYAVFAAWTVVLWILASWLLVRRDA